MISPITYMNGADINYKFEAGSVIYKLAPAPPPEPESGQYQRPVHYRFMCRLINASAESNGVKPARQFCPG